VQTVCPIVGAFGLTLFICNHFNVDNAEGIKTQAVALGLCEQLIRAIES